jgi:glycosyl transferase family 25
MLFLEQFDKIYIINLQSRADRRQDMEAELARLGLGGDGRVHYFNAIRQAEAGPFPRVGSHGAFLSHLAILEAHQRSGETVLILQDDCEFIQEALQSADSGDWDILYGGYYASDPADLQGSDIVGAHCMGFRPDVIPRLVEFLKAVYEGKYRPPGLAPDSRAAPIDGAIVWFRRAHPDVRALFQLVSFQRSSRTDIGDLAAVDRYPRLASSVRAILRFWKRQKLRLLGFPRMR